MKPHRVRMANSLVLHYGLHSKLDGVSWAGEWLQLDWHDCRVLLVTRQPLAGGRCHLHAAHFGRSAVRRAGMPCRPHGPPPNRGGPCLHLSPPPPSLPCQLPTHHTCRRRSSTGDPMLLLLRLARPVPQYYTPTRAGAEDMAAFHAEDYVDFLRTVTPDNMVRALGARSHRILECAEDCVDFLLRTVTLNK